MTETAADQPVGPLFVASRWDQLGGRLTAMVNAAAGAEAHAGTFGFVWPRAREAHLEDPTDLFTQEFLAQHELTDGDLAARTPVWFRSLVPLSVEQLRARFAAVEPAPFVDVAEVFSIIRWAHEPGEVATSRFRSCFARLGWNEAARAIIDSSHDWSRGGPRGAVHVRAGDIIDGDWDLFLGHAKYSPTPLVHEAIRQQSATGDVLVVSDNAGYLEWLVEHFPSVVTPRDLVPGYEAMSDIHRAFADLVLLSRSSTVIAPPSSAFSSFASLIGGATLVRSDELCDEGTTRDLMLQGLATAVNEARTSPSWAKLAPRDVLWHLDVFGDGMLAGERWSLAKQAVDLDPTFVGALTRYARACAERGDWTEAAKAADEAVALSEVAVHVDDPLFESLATRLLVACLDAIDHRRAVDRDFANEILARAEGLATNMTPKARVLEVLRALVAASSAPVRHALPDPTDAPSALSNHIAARHYDPLTPDVERMARRVGVTAEASDA